MKKITLLLSLTIALVLFGCNIQPGDKKQRINPILNDISFIYKFGHQPNSTTDKAL
jgi:hypothetical protein